MTNWPDITEIEAKQLGIERQYAMWKLEKEEERKSGNEKKKRKYHNKKPEVDGITFDSQKEADYYCQLKLLKKAGHIEDFELQPEFVLLGPENDYVTGRGIKYRADFKVYYPKGTVKIVDVKGYKTNVYKLKKKLLLAKYPDIDFEEVK